MNKAPITPAAPPVFEEVRLPTVELPPVAGLWPDEKFKESVRALGILEPLLVERAGRGFRLLAGRRRLVAARLAGLDSVPCRILERGSVMGAVVTLAENFQRKANPASEVEAIEELLKTTKSWQEIAEATGLPAAKLAERVRLIDKLHPELLAAFKAGKIAPGPAWAITKLPTAKQEKLVALLKKRPEITGADVREARGAVAKKKKPAQETTADGGDFAHVALSPDPVENVLEFVRRARVFALALPATWGPLSMCLEEAEGVGVRLQATFKAKAEKQKEKSDGEAVEA